MTAPRKSRSGAPWRRARAAEAASVELGPVARAVLGAVHAARLELGREPSVDELGARTGLGRPTVRRELDELERLGLTRPLTARQRDCLRAVAALEDRLGRSPSTREVSDEMGLAPSGSRFHIAGLVELGLVTPPEVRLVLAVTPAGRALV